MSSALLIGQRAHRPTRATVTYRPTDDDGPGAPTTVSIAVTDTPPVVTDDTATTAEDTAVTISVLTNDTDADGGDTLTVVAASDGLYGTTLVNGDGTITYTPGANFNGTDAFVYVIDDGHGRLSFATATVTVAAVNDAPVAVADTFTVLKNGTLTFDPRANDTDADGDTLTITAVTQGSHGTVAFTDTGITYTPDANYTGTDAFTYTVSDGHGGTSTATVTVSVMLPASVGGRVWDDDNHDGIQDTGEANRAGVEVRLLDADNNVIATVYTNSTGLFLFDGLLPGQYRIRVVAPIGTEFTDQDQGTDDAVDSDVNSAGDSALFTLTAGDTLGLDTGLVPKVVF